MLVEEQVNKKENAFRREVVEEFLFQTDNA